MVARCNRAPVRMTVAEFLAWDSGDRTGRAWQLIDGTPVPMALATEAHGALHSECGALLANHLLACGSACRVLVKPGIAPRIWSDRNCRVPDLAVTAAPPSGGSIVGGLMLPIDVLSPNDEAATRANIWAYASIPSVAEILVVHSTRIEAELLRRGSDGSWPEQPEILGRDATLALKSVGFSVPLAALYRTTALAVR